MNGAPKGDIFLAAVKQTRELEASLNVGEDKKVGGRPASYEPNVHLFNVNRRNIRSE